VSTVSRRFYRPSTFLIAGALAVGLLGAAMPAQATAEVPATTIPPAVVTIAATPAATKVSLVAALTPAQVATVRAAALRAAAARAAAVRAAAIRATAARALRARTTAVRLASSKIGSRYVAGRAGPTKFDCSGLTQFVVRHATGRLLPHYSRTQWRATARVARKNLRPGDLVFFFGRGAHHVGIYIGNGRMVSASNPRAGVKIELVFSGWYGSRYSGAGRLI